MKNVTISLPDEVYKKARMEAAKRETSLSGLMRELLTLADEGEQQAAAKLRRRRIIGEVLDEIQAYQKTRGKFFIASARLTRDQIHDRKAIH